MKPIEFAGVTYKLGAPKGWDEEKHGECAGLPISNINGEICVSRWKPTIWERFTLLFGGVIELSVFSGRSQPPVAVNVVRIGDQ